MGCDIHAIIEIKEKDKWRYIEDLPEVLIHRNYGFFSILNREIRNSYGINGFVPKGKPIDVSIEKTRFYSLKSDLESQYNRKGTYCHFKNDKDEDEYISIFDDRLLGTISKELCTKLKETGENQQQYLYPNPYKSKYNVRDASLVNGEFVSVSHSVVFPTLKEFNEAYYKHPWVEEEQDFGQYEFDLTRKDYHGFSYLNLSELKTKTTDFSKNKKYLVDVDFLTDLDKRLEYLSEILIIGDVIDNNAEVYFAEDEETSPYLQIYNNFVSELDEIKTKYGIENDENIRIVFCFDS